MTVLFRNIEYYFQELVANIKHNRFMNITAISTVMITLCILGSFMLTIVNLNYLSQDVLKEFKIIIFLKREVPRSRSYQLKTTLLKMRYVKNVKLVTKEQGWGQLKNRLRGKVDLSGKNTNPLPDYLEVETTDASKIKQVAKHIQALSEVDEAKYGRTILSKILDINKIAKTGALITAIFLGLGTLFIIHNTIRLTIFASRREIIIMQLVGATKWFIKIPFILEGILHGIAGGILAALILLFAYIYYSHKISQWLPFLSLVSYRSILLPFVLIMIGGGIFMGLTGSFIAVRRFLGKY